MAGIASRLEETHNKPRNLVMLESGGYGGEVENSSVYPAIESL